MTACSCCTRASSIRSIPTIRDALRDGITLTFDLDTRIERERRFWFDAEVVDADAAPRAVLSRGHRSLPRSRCAQRRAGQLRHHSRRRSSTSARVDALADTGRAATRRRQLPGQRARRRAPRAACPRRCARSCSGPTTGTVRASGTHGRCRYERWRALIGLVLVCCGEPSASARCCCSPRAPRTRASSAGCSCGSCCSISSASSRSPRCSRASSGSWCATIAITCRARASRRAPSRSSARWSSRRC